jgi:hypothetical protein
MITDIEKLIQYWCKNSIPSFGYARSYGGSQVISQYENYVHFIMPYRAVLEPKEQGIRYSFALDIAMKPNSDSDEDRAWKQDQCMEMTAQLVYFLSNLMKVYTENKLFYSDWVTVFPNATLQQPGVNVYVQSNTILGHEYARSGSMAVHTIELEVVVPFCYTPNMFNNYVPPIYPVK